MLFYYYESNGQDPPAGGWDFLTPMKRRTKTHKDTDNFLFVTV
jgi:hypothetical protein